MLDNIFDVSYNSFDTTTLKSNNQNMYNKQTTQGKTMTYMQTNDLDYASPEEQGEYDMYIQDIEDMITMEESVKIEANMITEYEITTKRSTTDVDLNEDDEVIDGENVWYS